MCRRIYSEIVNRRRDPAILEYAGDGLWQLRVFPLPPEGTQKVQLVFRQVLRSADGKVIYRSPQLVAGTVTEAQDFEFSATVAAPGGVDDVKPLDRAMGAQRAESGEVLLGFRKERFRLTDPVSFAFSAKAGTSGAASARVGDGAVFAAVMPPLEQLAGKSPPPRTVALVLDRSASMEGRGIRLALAAAGGMLARLAPGDSLAVVAAGSDVTLWKDKPAPATAGNVAAATEFLNTLAPTGGTDLAGGLRAAESFNTDPTRGLFIVLISDGLDVVGADEKGADTDGKARKAVSLPANARLLGIDVGMGGAMAPLSKIPNAVLAAVRGVRDVPAAVRYLTGQMDALPLTDVTMEIPAEAGVTEPAFSDPAPGREMVLAGMLAEAKPVRLTVKRSARLYGQTVSDTVDVDVPAPPAPAGAAPALRQIWAHLRVETQARPLVREDVKAGELQRVLDLARRHHVASSVTALLVLETDKDYLDRGIKPPGAGIDPKQALRDAQARLAESIRPAEGLRPSARTAVLRARELRRLGDYENAVSMLSKFLAQYPANLDARQERDLLEQVLALRVGARWDRVNRRDALPAGMDWRTVLQPPGPVELVRPDRGKPVPMPATAVPERSAPTRAVTRKLEANLPKVYFQGIALGDVI